MNRLSDCQHRRVQLVHSLIGGRLKWWHCLDCGERWARHNRTSDYRLIREQKGNR